MYDNEWWHCEYRPEGRPAACRNPGWRPTVIPWPTQRLIDGANETIRTQGIGSVDDLGPVARRALRAKLRKTTRSERKPSPEQR